mmetsp:Transcript_57489/g.182103  ORF Transcript_57489/g.182103 Transcript_57489/m.182103 type:complete len:238 (+) Transcript_57489:509-1222(+)
MAARISWSSRSEVRASISPVPGLSGINMCGWALALSISSTLGRGRAGKASPLPPPEHNGSTVNSLALGVSLTRRTAAEISGSSRSEARASISAVPGLLGKSTCGWALAVIISSSKSLGRRWRCSAPPMPPCPGVCEGGSSSTSPSKDRRCWLVSDRRYWTFLSESAARCEMPSESASRASRSRARASAASSPTWSSRIISMSPLIRNLSVARLGPSNSRRDARSSSTFGGGGGRSEK